MFAMDYRTESEKTRKYGALSSRFMHKIDGLMILSN